MTTVTAQVDLTWDPFTFQSEAISMLRRKNVWVVSRQAGKTAMLKIVNIMWPLRFPGTRYGFVTPTLKRSGEVFREMMLTLQEVKDSRGKPIATMSQQHKQIHWTNGSVTEFVSMEQQEGLQGGTWNGMTCDECQLMLGWIINEALRPMLSATGGWTIYSGKPPNPETAPDPFFYEEQLAEACRSVGVSEDALGCFASDDYSVVHLDHTCRSEVDRLYKKYVQEEEITLDRQQFEREYLTIFTKPGEGSLDISLLQYFSEYADLPKEMNVIITVDPSFGRGEHANPRAVIATGLSPDGDLYVLWAEAERWSYSEFINKIYECWKFCVDLGHEPDQVSLEVNGPGLPFYEALIREGEVRDSRGEKPSYLPVREIPSHQSAQAKRQRILSVEPWLRQRRVWLLKNELNPHSHGCRQLKTQMAVFPRGLTAGTKKGVEGHHYDLLDAFAYRTIDFSPQRSDPDVVESKSSGVIVQGGKIYIQDNDYELALVPAREHGGKFHV